MPRKKTKTGLKNKADKLFSLYIREKNKYTCQACKVISKGRGMQCAHIDSRRYLITRWEENNALCLCAKCHRYYHDYPRKFIKYLEDFHPKKLKFLEHKRREYKKWTIADYEELIEELNAKIYNLT